MTEPQPEYVWAFPEETPRRSRMWLMIGLAIVAIAVAVAVVLAVVRPWETAAEPSSSTTSSPTPSASASSTPSVSPTPTATPTPSSTPTPVPTSAPPAPTAPPAPSDPALPVFRDKVQPRLDDASTGLTYAQDASGEEGVQIADQLRDDAGRLSDVVAPSSIASAWRSGVQEYGQALDALRAAFVEGGSTSTQLSSARAKLAALKELVGG